jgi:hypothetical protein
MVKVEVVNWRCVEDLGLELAKVNLFVGPNSGGKSSLAYAIYLASRSARVLEPQTLALQLYGCGFDGIARLVDGRPQFPLSISIEDAELCVELREQKPEVVKRPLASPWADEFLLPSKRAAYLQIMQLLPKMGAAMWREAKPEGLGALVAMAGGLFELFKQLPLIPPFTVFANDCVRALTGVRPQAVEGTMEGIGSYMVAIHFLTPLMGLTFRDPYIKEVQLLIDSTPEGLLDIMMLDSMVKRVPEGSLLIVEEPEIHKNPRSVMELTERMVRGAIERRLTLVTTTHSDLLLSAVGKLVEGGILRPEDVRAYYLKRDPWTRASEIKVYEDGTMEGWPDMDEVVARLF